MHDFAFVLAGFAVGLIVGLTGVGGGSLMTSVLIFFFGVKPQRQGAELAARRANSANAAEPRHWSLLVLPGAVIGTLVTFTSVGAGAIGVAVLLLVFPHLPLPRIIAADLAYAVPLTLVAGLGHASLGSVDWLLLLLQLLAGSLPGIWLGGCRALGGESEKWPQRGQFCSDLQPHSRAMGQKPGPKWTAAAVLQPPIPKSDSLLGSRLVSRTPERLIRSALSPLLARAGAKLVLI